MLSSGTGRIITVYIINYFTQNLRYGQYCAIVAASSSFVIQKKESRLKWNRIWVKQWISAHQRRELAIY